jgi:hypothetical protein
MAKSAVTFICKTAGCGEDLTAEVIRKLTSVGIEMRARYAREKIDPVVVTCSKGHAHGYP